ncbi:MAG: hypothetical protein GX134_07070 [candidate division WS1 bacterium]|jgi:hypothetical protein|nr:hypothetical protein [candidate division WS1 bacterium]
MQHAIRLLGWATLCVLVGVGCGKKAPAEAAGQTPEETAKAFAAAMASGDTKTAAAYWAYDAQARQDNPDWDSFPPGQRSQIKAKLRKSKAEELRAGASVFAGADKGAETAAQGDQVTVSGSGRALAVISVTQSDSGYQVTGYAPAS